MKKNIHKKIDLILSVSIVAILLPLFVASIGQRMELEELIYGQDLGLEETEQKLVGIVAKEINAGAETEAILAQCVIARTALMDALKNKTAEPQGMEASEMRELWGEQFDMYYEKIESCVRQTDGEVLMWEGDYAYVPYHAISAGSTRNMKELYNNIAMPYLKMQICEKDAVAEGYLAVSYWEKDNFVAECANFFPESKIHTYEDIVIEKKDEAGYVLQIKVGEVTMEGESFREAFGLNSSHFTIALVDENVRIVTKGLGHGFGLSQNTANEMAKNGDDYRSILQYFFPGTELENE